MRSRLVILALLAFATACSGSDNAAPQDLEVELTWLGVTQWLVQRGDTTILLDAYFSRPAPGITQPTEEGLDLMQRVLNAAGVDSIDFIFVGHSHFDHAVDCGAVAMRTGAQVVGTQTTCLVAQAEGLPAERCTVVGNGDVVEVEGVSVQAIRTIHFSPQGIGRFADLDEQPTDVWDVPVGGVVSFLFTFEGDVPFSMLYQNSLGPLDGDDGSSENYSANLDNVLGDLDETTLWLAPVGFLSDASELGAYYSRVRPRFVLAQHWDGLTPDIEAGVMTSFRPSDAVTEATNAAGATLLTQEQYFDRFVLSTEGVARSEDAPVQDAFGL